MHNDNSQSQDTDKSQSQSIPFTVRWRGYDQREVDEEVAWLWQDLDEFRQQVDVLRVDRDAAVATADHLARELEHARSEIAEYRVLHAGYSKDNAVSACIRYLMHVARQKADAFETDARERSEQMLKRAEDVARRQAVLLDETEQETQRRLAEAEQRAHETEQSARETVQRVREILQEAMVEAEALLADQALVDTTDVDTTDQRIAETEPAPDVPLPRLTSGPLIILQPDTEPESELETGPQRPTSA